MRTSSSKQNLRVQDHSVPESLTGDLPETLNAESQRLLQSAEDARFAGDASSVEAYLSSAWTAAPSIPVGIALAEWYQQTDRLAYAERLLQSLLKSVDRCGNVQASANLLFRLATVRRQRGDVNQSLSDYGLAQAFSEKSESPDILFEIETAITLGDLQGAEQRILEQLHQTSPPSDEAELWGLLGVVSVLKGNPRRGIRMLWHAYEMHRDQGADYLAACDLLNVIEPFAACDRPEAVSTAITLVKHHADRVNAKGLLQRLVEITDQLRITDAARTACWN